MKDHVHRSAVNIVAQMLVRNEADVIEETLEGIARWGVRTVVILDGGSDDGTVERIEAFATRHLGVAVDLLVSPDPGSRFADHRRQELMEMTRRHDPDWIISVDGDEIYHSDPVLAVLAAEAAGANVVWGDVAQFWITLADVRNGLACEDERIPVQKRRRWHSMGHTGVFIWKDDPNHFYPRDVQKRTPEHRGEPDFRKWQRPGPMRAICKHYPYRSLRQALKRQEERMQRGGPKYFGKYRPELDWIIDEEWCDLDHFRGRFDFRKDNHRKVAEYMGRLVDRKGG